MHNPEENQLTRRLDVVIAILLMRTTVDGKNLTARDKIGVLTNLGMRPVEISKILAKPLNYVTKEQASIKKKNYEKN